MYLVNKTTDGSLADDNVLNYNTRFAVTLNNL